MDWPEFSNRKLYELRAPLQTTTSQKKIANKNK